MLDVFLSSFAKKEAFVKVYYHELLQISGLLDIYNALTGVRCVAKSKV